MHNQQPCAQHCFRSLDIKIRPRNLYRQFRKHHLHPSSNPQSPTGASKPFVLLSLIRHEQKLNKKIISLPALSIRKTRKVEKVPMVNKREVASVEREEKVVKIQRGNVTHQGKEFRMTTRREKEVEKKQIHEFLRKLEPIKNIRKTRPTVIKLSDNQNDQFLEGWKYNSSVMWNQDDRPF